MPRVIILDSFPLSSAAKREPDPTAMATTLDHCQNWIKECVAAGCDIVVATSNVRHLSRFVPADLWTNIRP